MDNSGSLLKDLESEAENWKILDKYIMPTKERTQKEKEQADKICKSFRSKLYRNRTKITDLWERPLNAYYEPSGRYLRTQLKNLMGTEQVHLSNKKYWDEMEEQMFKEYSENQQKKIKERQEYAINQRIQWIREGKLPLSAAPRKHVLYKIHLFEEKMRKIKEAKMKRMEKYKELQFHSSVEILPMKEMYITSKIINEEEDIERGYMFIKEEYEKLKKYESPLVKELKETEDLDEMYAFSKKMILPLWTWSPKERCPEHRPYN